jgi:hypothetical protein
MLIQKPCYPSLSPAVTPHRSRYNPPQILLRYSVCDLKHKSPRTLISENINVRSRCVGYVRCLWRATPQRYALLLLPKLSLRPGSSPRTPTNRSAQVGQRLLHCATFTSLKRSQRAQQQAISDANITEIDKSSRVENILLNLPVRRENIKDTEHGRLDKTEFSLKNDPQLAKIVEIDARKTYEKFRSSGKDEEDALFGLALIYHTHWNMWKNKIRRLQVLINGQVVVLLYRDAHEWPIEGAIIENEL